ncbi:PAS domain-containing sensor histidine kinase [Megalodesulfovibrio paquesii]
MSHPPENTPHRFFSLRKRAEDALARMALRPQLDPAEMGDVRELMHELSIYQVELEMQNDELRHAQQALEQSHRLSDALLSTSPIGMLLVNAEALVLRSNLAAARMLGLDKVHLEGQRFSMFVDPDSLYEFQGTLAQSLDSQAKPQSCEIILRRIGGIRFHARFDCSPLRLEDQQQQQIVCTFQDISDSVSVRESLRQENRFLDIQLQQRACELEARNRQLEELLRQYETAKAQAQSAQRAKTAFLHNMSHELRTPLHGLMSLSELLMGTLHAPQERELVALAKSGVIGLVELFQDLLDLAAMEADALQVRLTPTPPQQIFDAVLRSMAPVAATKGVELHDMPCPLHAAPASCAGVMTDPVRLKQVLLALLSNAIKFSSAAGGPVVLRCELEDKQWCYVIEDHGPGLPPECLQEALEPFVQGQESMRLTRTHAGLGTGLPLARRLTGLLGGTLLLENKSNGGVRATVCLPAAPLSACGQDHSEQ